MWLADARERGERPRDDWRGMAAIFRQMGPTLEIGWPKYEAALAALEDGDGLRYCLLLREMEHGDFEVRA